MAPIALNLNGFAVTHNQQFIFNLLVVVYAFP